jgi:hypothetical protein
VDRACEGCRASSGKESIEHVDIGDEGTDTTYLISAKHIDIGQVFIENLVSVFPRFLSSRWLPRARRLGRRPLGAPAASGTIHLVARVLRELHGKADAAHQ